MLKIIVEERIAEEIRNSPGSLELVDQTGKTIAFANRPPTAEEIEFARSRMGSTGPKFTFDELIEKIEATPL